MAYTAITPGDFRKRGGTLAEKISAEFEFVDEEIDDHKSKFVVLTAGVGTPTALATAGIDLASGSDIQIYGAFVAPVDITLVKMHDYLTEAYVKETTDAKIEVYDGAGTPTKLSGNRIKNKEHDVGAEARGYHSQLAKVPSAPSPI
ncbi:hypothetical protein [Methanococcoides sp. AM1]|uniref:hypothetical protein n=1 Tax=Methanococcoides sp. AM1 TaxID=1201011 RepID=UPI001083095B|nr:hypothetical protein [Methanococcoides sp. AM1]